MDQTMKDIFASAVTPAGYSDIEWKARVELALCYRMVDYYGWTTQVYNHVSYRIPGTEHLLINAFGLLYSEITPSNLVKIDFDGNKVDASPYPMSFIRPCIRADLMFTASCIPIILMFKQ